MAAALGASVLTTGSTNPQTTAAITTQATGSTFLVFFVTQNGVTVNSVTDSKSNVYTLVDSEVETNDGTKHWVYKSEDGTGGASHTFTLTLASGSIFQVAGVEITDAGAVDTNNSTYDSSTPFNCAVTTSEADTLIVAASHTGAGAGGTYTANGGFTEFLEDNASAVAQIVLASRAAATANSYDPAWTHSTRNEHASLTVAVKSAVAAGVELGADYYRYVAGMGA